MNVFTTKTLTSPSSRASKSRSSATARKACTRAEPEGQRRERDVGLRKGGASWSKAENAGLSVKEVAEAVKSADVVMMLLPDEQIADVYAKEVHANIKQGAALAFAHGFNVHYGAVIPRADLDVIMIAPKAPGHTVRGTYSQGGGVPHLIAVAQNKSGAARDIALSYAAANGGGRAGIIETNFREETETDLFGEQACCAAVPSS